MASLLLLVSLVTAQTDPINPERGIVPGASYSISDIEVINTTNGNLILNIPLASLPKGRGEVGQSISLTYNSKLFDTTVEETLDQSQQMAFQNMLKHGDTGGWRYVTNDYELDVISRFDPSSPPFDCQGPDAGKNTFKMKVVMHMPDGSTKEFRPTGFDDIYLDGFFKVMPSGYLASTCSSAETLYTTGGMAYYSTDGSYMKLVVDYQSGGVTRGEGNPWTLYMSDGSRIERDGGTITKYDRNGNSITGFEDEFERSISLDKNVSTNVDEVTMKGPGGEDLVWTINWRTITFGKQYQTTGSVAGFGQGGTSTQTFNGSFKVVDSIQLPSQLGTGLKYEFEYNTDDSGTGWGEISKVKMPSGAYSEYEYTTPITTNTDNVLRNYVSEKTLNYDLEYDGTTSAAPEETWTYLLTKVQATITAPNGSVTIEKFGDTTYKHKNRGLVYKTSDNNGNISERIWDHQNPPAGSEDIDINAYVKTEFTTIPDYSGSPSLTKIVDYTRDLNGNVTEIREYDWVSYSSVPKDGNGNATGIPGGAVLKRVTNNVYNNSTSTSSSNGYWSSSSPNIRNSLKSSTVSDGSSTPVPYAHTEFFYDNAATTGNLTQTRMWSSGSLTIPLSGSNYISTSATYDSYGNPLQITDANGNITKYTYGDIQGPSQVWSSLYPTRVEVAYNTSVERTSMTAYDFYTGLPVSVTDVDNDVTTTTDYDEVGRPELVTMADESDAETRTSYEYDSEERFVIVRSDLESAGDGKLVSITHFDQLGRVRLARTLEDPVNEDPEEGEDGIKVQTRYITAYDCSFDSNSTCSSRLVSNPYRAATSAGASSEGEMGWTLSETRSDGLVSQVKTITGSGLPFPFETSSPNEVSTGAIQTHTDADRSLVVDQAGKMRISRTNALGHLTDVWEVTSQDSETSAVTFPGSAGSGVAYGYKTSYVYDPLNNLTTVNQGVQTRSFTYSPLSRLLTAANPESGTISYGYDSNGNLTSKTDARSVTTTYQYDALNRVTQRSYNDQITPTVTYTYDQSGIANSIGRLTKVTSELGSSDISETRYTEYDELGRVKASVQITPVGTEDFTSAPARTMGYEYNLAGALVEETYPSGRVVRNSFDGVGRLSEVESKKNSTAVYWKYAGLFTYTAAGAVSSMRHGNGTWEKTEFNARLQPTIIALGSTPGTANLLSLAYEYNTETSGTPNADNNGNVLSQTIDVPDVGQDEGFEAVQTYTYDPLNRIKTAQEMIDESSTASWKQTFTYDRYGNRNFDEDPASTTTLTWGCLDGQDPAICPEDREKENPEIDKDTNRIEELQPDGDQDEDYEFDDAGNTILDPEGRQFFYDGENKQITVKDIGNNIIGEYVYDGDGRRVMKKVPLGGGNTETTVVVYDAGGKLVAEYSTTVASQQDAQVSYLTNDHLGSPRITTDKNGKVYSRRDFLPFGEALTASINPERTPEVGYGPDSIRQKFTGYERDNETGLDFAQARYLDYSLGRFNSPDPLHFQIRMVIDPQVFNLYPYVRNNPYRWVDPDGERLVLRGDLGWLRINVLYELVGGQENFENYFEIVDGEVQIRPDITEMPDNAGVAELVSLINASEVYLYFAGENGEDALALFDGYNNREGGVAAFRGRQRQGLVDKFEGNTSGCLNCGTLVGTNGRWSALHPQSLANGDAVFAVVAFNTNTIQTQSSISYGEATGDERDGLAAVAGETQANGLNQNIRPVSYFIHESTENQFFAAMSRRGQALDWSTYRPAHSAAILREHRIRQELGITGGFAGGGVTSIVSGNQ